LGVIFIQMYLATICGALVLLAGLQAQAAKAFFVFQESQPAPAQEAPQTNPPGDPKQEQQQTKPEEPAPPPSPNPDATVIPDNSNANPDQGATPDSTPAKPATVKKPAAVPTVKKTTPRKRSVKQPPTRPEGSKVVIRNGSTSEPNVQLSSGAKQQATQQIQSANSLLDATNTNLKKISDKKLDADQQDMVKQIRDYMEQSKSAAAAGDPHGAQTLATKAHLLSEELIKP
jgi:hypothetical protein